MGAVIPQDFGKENRESARNLARLMHFVEAQEADILANPGKYLDMAGKRLAEHELFVHELWETLQRPVQMVRPDEPPGYLGIDTIVVDRREYEALKKAERLIRARYLATS